MSIANVLRISDWLQSATFQAKAAVVARLQYYTTAAETSAAAKQTFKHIDVVLPALQIDK